MRRARQVRRRLHAEFDNFRKRTAKERLDLLQTPPVRRFSASFPCSMTWSAP